MSGPRTSMTMRADVQRDQTSTDNAWGTPDKPSFATVITGQPCRVWSRQRRDLTDDGKSVVIDDMRAMFPSSADVQDEDRLVNVQDRKGTVLFTGPLAVETVSAVRGPGSRVSHLEAMLQRNV